MNPFGTNYWEQHFPASPRSSLVLAYVEIALEHQKAISTLVRAGLKGLRLAVMLLQLETALRGMWVHLIASDIRVDCISQHRDEPFPRFQALVKQADEVYGTQGWLESFADQWAALNGYTHSRLEQLGMRFQADENLAPSYPDETISDLLALSGTVTIGTIVPLFRASGSCSQSGNSCRSGVKVPNDRTGSAARSADTATKISFAPMSMPAASACNIGSIRLLPWPFSVLFLAMWGSLPLEPAARGYEASKFLDGIAAAADVTTDLCVTSDPCFPTGFSRAPMSAAGYGCHRRQQHHYLPKRVPPVPAGTPHPMLSVTAPVVVPASNNSQGICRLFLGATTPISRPHQFMQRTVFTQRLLALRPVLLQVAICDPLRQRLQQLRC